MENQIVVDTYRNGCFSTSSKRSLLAKTASIVIEKAYWNVDDDDPVVQLSYTIDEPVLKDRVAKAVSELGRVGVSGTRKG